MAQAVSTSQQPDSATEVGTPEIAPLVPVTPPVRTADDLLHQAEQLSSMLANVPGAVFRCRNDRDWTISYISDGIESISGYKADELVERLRTYAGIVHPEDRDKVTDAIQQALEQGTWYSVEYRLVDPNGQTRWVYEKGRASGVHGGHADSLDGAVLEVTELKNAEEQLRWEAEVNAAISELHKPLISPYSFLDDVARALLTQALRLTRSTQGYVSIIDPHTHQHLAQALTPGFRRHCVSGEQSRSAAGESTAGWCDLALSRNEPSHAEDGTNPFHCPKAPHDQHTEEVLCVPVRLNDQLVGAITLANPRRRYEQRERAAIQRLASLYAMAIQRLRAEDALRISEERFRVAFQTSPDCIAITRLDGTVVNVNSGFCASSGYELNEVLGKTAAQLKLWANPEDRERILAALHKDGAVTGVEASFRHKTGEVHAGLISAKLISLDKQLHVLWMMRNVEDAKRTQAALAATQAAERGFKERLTALHEVTRTLALCESTLDIYRTAVILGRERLGFDRLGIWLTAGDGTIEGTFGTDEQGRLRDERGMRLELVPGTRAMLEGKLQGHPMFVRDCDLFDEAHRAVGHGDRIVAPVWDGSRNIGLIMVDNLLGHRPLQQEDVEVITLFAASVGHLCFHRQAEEALRKRERSLQALYGSMNEGLAVHEMIYDDQGRAVDYVFTDLNAAAERMLGIIRDQAVGRPVRDLFEMDTPPFLRVYDQVARTGQRTVFESYWEPLKKWFRVSAFSPSPGCFATVFEDVSAQKAAAAERTRLEEQLQQSRKIEAVGQLAGGVAHDFNNMLTVILGHLDLARMQLAGEHPAQQPLSMVEQAARQAAGVTRSLLTFSRRVSTSKEPVQVAELANQAAALLRRTLPGSIELEVDLADGVDAWITADATQIQQVLLNLALNARDAMPSGGRLCVSIGRKPAEPPRQPAAVTISVSDTGQGIRPETLPRIFEPFFTTKPRGQGTGLGLSIVHGIVRDHGGSIEVQSRPGRGTTFTVTLPAAGVPDNTLRVTPPATIPERLCGRVLLVEDNSGLRALLTNLLSASGLEVIEAADGLAMLEAYQAQRGSLNLMIVDLDLPKRGGLDCLSDIRDLGDQTRALVVTGSAEEGLEAKLPVNTALLRKPFTTSALRQAVAANLRANQDR